MGNVPTGLRFGASQSIPSLNASQAIAQISKAAQDQGLEVYANHQDGAKITLDIGPQSSSGPAKYMSRIVADETSNNVTIVTVLKPGVAADPVDSQKRLCTLLASANGGTNSDVVPTVPANTQTSSDVASRTTPPPAVEPSPATAPSRTAPPSDVNILKPSATFDLASAKSALEPGNATITGTACTRHSVEGGGGMYLAANKKVLLFPDTPYLEEFLKLMRHAKAGRDQVYGDPQFFATRLEGMTNSKGQFRFAQMKPGKYYLFTQMTTAVDGTHMGGGVDASGPVIVHYTTFEDFSVNYDDVMDKFVTVEDGQTVDITLTGHPTWRMILQPRFNNGYAGLLGCKELP